MMHFMVIWTFKPEHREETVARFMIKNFEITHGIKDWKIAIVVQSGG